MARTPCRRGPSPSRPSWSKSIVLDRFHSPLAQRPGWSLTGGVGFERIFRNVPLSNCERGLSRFAGAARCNRIQKGGRPPIAQPHCQDLFSAHAALGVNRPDVGVRREWLGPDKNKGKRVEMMGVEPTTSALRTLRSPN